LEGAADVRAPIAGAAKIGDAATESIAQPVPCVVIVEVEHILSVPGEHDDPDPYSAVFYRHLVDNVCDNVHHAVKILSGASARRVNDEDQVDGIVQAKTWRWRRNFFNTGLSDSRQELVVQLVFPDVVVPPPVLVLIAIRDSVQCIPRGVYVADCEHLYSAPPRVVSSTNSVVQV